MVFGLVAALGIGRLLWQTAGHVANDRVCRGCNLVLVVLDAARADHMSLYGYGRPTTPNIDRFAREALVFDHAYVEASYTIPSVASLLTGLPPDTHRVVTVKTPLAPEAVTMAELLAGRSYRTAAFCENPLLTAEQGFSQGFETFQTLGRAIRTGGVQDYDVSDARADVAAAVAWATAGGTAPFLLYVHLLRPHAPYRPLPEHVGRFSRPYAGAVTGASRDLIAFQFGGREPSDEDIARLIDRYDENLLSADALFEDVRTGLADAGLLDSTILVLLADHGEELHDHGKFLHGVQVYDESIHVPVVIRLPPSLGVEPRRIAAPVQLVDVAHMLVRALVGAVPWSGPGRDLLDLREVPARTAAVPIVSQTMPGFATRAVREGDLKLIEIGGSTGGAGRRHLLFDLARDPGEHVDLADERPRDVERLTSDLRSIEARRRSHALKARPRRAAPPEVGDALRMLGYVE
jgi:arylsulfatase A-like enzyme